MMPSLKVYDPAWDELFQCEISDETAGKLDAAQYEISSAPFDGIPIKSRLASERRSEREGC